MSCRTIPKTSIEATGSRRSVQRVECLNRRKRRERTKYPKRFNKPNPKTRYAEVGRDGNDGSTLDLVAQTTGLNTGMAVTWLGTSSGSPTLTRNVTGILLRLPERNLLFDAGEGTQTQLLKADVFPSSIKRIFITHLHGDHCFGLPGLLSLINQIRIFNDKGERMYVYGPPGLGELIKMALPHWFDRFRMPISIVEFGHHADDGLPQKLDPNGHVTLERMLPTDEARVELDENFTRGRYQSNHDDIKKGYRWHIDIGDGITVTAAQLQHRVPCWGYVVQEADYVPAQWELDLWKEQRLGDGIDASLISNEAARQSLSYTGRKVVILGDTCNSETVLSIGRHADLLSHEATFSEEMMHKAVRAQHSTATMAGEFARRLEAKHLVLTHFSPRYCKIADGSGNGENDIGIQKLVRQAKKAFKKDAVLAAHDFMTVDVPINRSLKTKQTVLNA